MTLTKTYETESQKLAKAIDIAVDAFTHVCPKNFTKENQDHFIKTYLKWKESCLNPEAKYRNLQSLKYDINNVFTYFQEGTGPTVEYFWGKIAEAGLYYNRENRIKKILDRGKIRGRVEFECVVDMFVVAQQNGMITKDEALRLSDILKNYELKNKNE